MQFNREGQIQLGVIKGDEVVAVRSLEQSLPNNMKSSIKAGPTSLDIIRDRLSTWQGNSTKLGDVEWSLPIESPEKFLCLGLNYFEHAKEGGNVVPDHPTIFMRTASSLVAHGQSIMLPKVDKKLDYEAELLLVIGKRAKYLTEDNALDYVWGYSIFNDGSMRKYQRWTSQWTLGKNFDCTGGVGPWVVTADELPPGGEGLDIEMRLNGQVMQSANTREMVFDVVRTLVDVTQCMTLEPGDCIAMGTPAGVGYARNPPVFMKPGDVAEVEIEGIGILRNTIAAEDDDSGG